MGTDDFTDFKDNKSEIHNLTTLSFLKNLASTARQKMCSFLIKF